MFSPIKRKRSSILGIDLSAGSIKIIELSQKSNAYCVHGYGRLSFPLHAMEGHVIKDVHTVALALKKLVSAAAFISRRAVVAVPDSAVMTQVIQIHNNLSECEIEALVFMETEKYISYPLSELNIDFKVLGPVPTDPMMQRVLIVATRSENISNWLDVLRQAGLKVNIVDVESFAIERVIQQPHLDWPAHDETKVVALINFGIVSICIYVLQGKDIIYSREEMIEGDRFCLHIEKMLQYFFSESQAQSVEHFVLAGEMVNPLEVKQQVEIYFGVETTLFNPLAMMSFSKKVDQHKIMSRVSSWMLACGLALRHFE